MDVRIVADSAANLLRMEGVDFVSVPLTIQVGGRAYRDTPELRVSELLRELDASDGPTGSACPGVGDWLDAFGDGKEIFVLTVTGGLSGSFQSAAIAAREYMQEHPDRRVEVMDSLSAGPQIALLAERFAAMARAGIPFSEACVRIRVYRKRTQLAFLCPSLDNFARNGRVSPALAKLVTMLHVHILGRASAEGTLEPLNKCRGRDRGMAQLWKNMKAAGYAGGRVRIHHTENEAGASELRRTILAEYPGSDVQLGENRGLCAYYAERGGLLVGYEIDPSRRNGHE